MKIAVCVVVVCCAVLAQALPGQKGYATPSKKMLHPPMFHAKGAGIGCKGGFHGFHGFGGMMNKGFGGMMGRGFGGMTSRGFGGSIHGFGSRMGRIGGGRIGPFGIFGLDDDLIDDDFWGSDDLFDNDDDDFYRIHSMSKGGNWRRHYDDDSYGWDEPRRGIVIGAARGFQQIPTHFGQNLLGNNAGLSSQIIGGHYNGGSTGMKHMSAYQNGGVSGAQSGYVPHNNGDHYDDSNGISQLPIYQSGGASSQGASTGNAYPSVGMSGQQGSIVGSHDLYPAQHQQQGKNVNGQYWV